MFFLLLLSAQQRVTAINQSIIIEDFDDPESSLWIVRGNKFLDTNVFQTNFVNTWPTTLYRDEPEDKKLFAFGVRAAFSRKGYNFLEFIPAERGQTGELIPRRHGLQLPGKIRSLNVWIWGSNYNYSMDLHLQDYRGVVHVLRLGKLEFNGWGNITTRIPPYIPQSARHLVTLDETLPGGVENSRRGLRLMKLVLWTDPNEQVGGFFVYLDEIQIETDVYEPLFDGERLSDPVEIQRLWSTNGGL